MIAPTARWILRRRTDAQSAAVPIKLSYFNGRVVLHRGGGDGGAEELHLAGGAVGLGGEGPELPAEVGAGAALIGGNALPLAGGHGEGPASDAVAAADPLGELQ